LFFSSPLLTSFPVQRKKGKAAIADDLFSDDSLLEDELIKDLSPVFSAKAPSEQVQDSTVPSTPLPKTEGRKRPVLPPAVRLERFDTLLRFMGPRIGRNPTMQKPLVKKRSWLVLLDLAANKDEIQKIIDLFPKYKDGKGEFPKNFADDFSRWSPPFYLPFFITHVLYRTVPSTILS